MLIYNLKKLPFFVIALVIGVTLAAPLGVYAQGTSETETLEQELEEDQANEDSGEGEEQGEVTSPITGGVPAPVLDASATPATRNLKQACVDRQKQRFTNDNAQTRDRFKRVLTRAIDTRLTKLRTLHGKVDKLRGLSDEEKRNVKKSIRKDIRTLKATKSKVENSNSLNVLIKLYCNTLYDLRVYSFRGQQVALLNMLASVKSTNRGLNRLHDAYSQHINKAGYIKASEKSNMQEDLDDAKAVLDQNTEAINHFENNLRPTLINASPADLNDRAAFLNQFRTALNEISDRNYDALESLYSVGVQLAVVRKERSEIIEIDVAFSEGEFKPGQRPKKAEATIATNDDQDKVYELRRERNRWVVTTVKDLQSP